MSRDRGECVAHLRNRPGSLALGDDVWRHQVEDITEGTKQKPAVEAGPSQPRAE